MVITDCNAKGNPRGRELAEHETALFPVACYLDDLQKMPVPWHWHDEWEVIVVAEGEAEVAAGPERLTLRTGEGCLIGCEVMHAAWSAKAGPCRLHSVAFHPALIGGPQESIFWQRYLSKVLGSPSCRFKKFSQEDDFGKSAVERIEAAWQACEAEAPGYEFTVRRALSEVIAAVWSQLSKPESPRRRSLVRNDATAKTMLTFIEEHFAEELTVEEIAASASINESECIRCFRKALAVTPIRYVRQLRLQTAAEHLIHTDDKIAEIGTLCGFQEMSYFARSFREQFGETPSEYRRTRR